VFACERLGVGLDAATQHLAEILGGAVGTPVVTRGIRTAVSRTLAAGAAIGTAVMPLGIRTAVSRTLAAGAAVRTAVMPLGIRTTVSRTLAAAGSSDVVVVDRHETFSFRTGGLSQGPCAVG
jgi:hypothetical protein